MGEPIMVGFERPQFWEHEIEDDPIWEHKERGYIGIEESSTYLVPHVSNRYGGFLKQEWNIGVIGFGDEEKGGGVGKHTLKYIKQLSEHSISTIGEYYIATGSKENVEQSVEWDLNRLMSKEQAKRNVMKLDWGNLGSEESKRTLDTIVRETDICIISAHDIAEFRKVCEEEGATGDEEDKRRDMQTKGNIKWVKKIAPHFRNYKGIVLMVSNLSDDLAYAFAKHSGMDPYRVVGMSNVDTERLNAMKEEIRWKLIDYGLGITGDTPLKKFEVYSVGTHDDPHPLVYYEGVPLEQIEDRDMNEIRGKLKEWGFKVTTDSKGKKKPGATADNTGKATAETVIQMLDGIRPVPISVLFDYKSPETKRKKQGYFTVPVMFKLEEIMKCGKRRLRPRPYVIQPQIDFLFEQEDFRRVIDEHAAKLRARTIKWEEDGEEEPMFPVIEEVHGDPLPGVFDFGDLYAVSDAKNALNKYLLAGQNGKDISPIQKRMVGLQKFRIDEEGDICCVLDWSKEGGKTRMHVGFLEDDKPKFEMGPFEDVIIDAIKRGNQVYVALVKDDDSSTIAKFDCRKHSEDEIKRKVREEGLHRKHKVHAFEIANIDGGRIFYSSGSKIYHTGLGLEEPTPFADVKEGVLDKLKVIPGKRKRLVIASDHNNLYFWSFDDAETPPVRIPIHNGAYDVDLRGDRLRVLTLSRGGKLELARGYLDDLFQEGRKTAKSVKDLFQGREGSEYTSIEEVNNMSKINLFGEYVFIFPKKGTQRLLRALREDFSEVCEFKIQNAKFMSRYKVR